MHKDIEAYNNQSNEQDKAILERLAALIDEELKEAEKRVVELKKKLEITDNI